MKIKDWAATLFFAALSVLLVSIWFRDGLIYGGGDVGLPTYDPARILDVIRYVWWDASAPGFPRSQGVTGIPLYLGLSLLQKLGFSFVFIQAGLFALLLFLMGFGMYLVAKEVFGKESYRLAALAALLYLFNPYMLNQWHRFVHTSLYLAAALPFLFLLWKRWMDGGSRKSLLLFLAINVFGAAIYSTLAFVVTVWLFLGFYFLYALLVPRKDFAQALSYIKRFVGGFISWILVSLWWLWPVFTTAPAVLSVQHNTLENVSTLLSISSQSVIPFSLQGVNPFYVFQEMDWGEIYLQKHFLLLPWLLVAFAILGFIRSLGDRRYAFWGLLFVFSLFLAKGAASPFGQTFTFLFQNVFLLGALRNPFEKLGVLIPFGYAILIPLGVLFLTTRLRGTLKLVVSVLVLVIVGANIFVWNWPFWKGQLFGNAYNPAKVEVPSYYKEADRWLEEQNKSGRILHLPLTVGEAVGYDWEHGYNGVEPSQLLFSSNPSISHGFNLNYVDDSLKTIQDSLRFSSVIEEGRLRELFSVFGIRYVVLHMDTIPVSPDIEKPEALLPVIENLTFLRKVGEFGKLKVYEVKEETFRDRIYLTSGYEYLYLGKENQFWPWILKDNTRVAVSPFGTQRLGDDSASTIVVSSNSFTTPTGPLVQEENLLNELPAIRFLPTSRFYPLIRLKESIEKYSTFGRDRLITQINFSSKRLAEAIRLKNDDRAIPIDSLLQDYLSLINEIFPAINFAFPTTKPVLEATFVKHILALNRLKDYSANSREIELISDAEKELRRKLSASGLNTFFEVREKGTLTPYNRFVFTFEIENPGEYEIIAALFPGEEAEEELTLQIDEKIVIRRGNKFGSLVSYGKFYFEKGYHEISYNIESIPLQNSSLSLWKKSEIGETQEGEGALTITSGRHEPAFIEISLDDIVYDSFYVLEFEYWVQRGNGPRVRVLQDADPIVKGERQFGFNRVYPTDIYNRYWGNAVASFKPRKTSRDVKLQIMIEPWDDCEIIQAHRKTLCKDEEFKKQFQRPSTVVLRGLKISRLEDFPLFLRAVETEDNRVPSLTQVEFESSSPVRYAGSFSINQPQLLVFSETFAPGWQLVLFKDGKRIIPEEKVLVNLFANGWFIEEPGEYQFTLEYTPERRVQLGGLISMLFFGGIVWYARRK